MDANYTRAYEEFEKKHWWHVARGELIRWAIDRYVPQLDRARWLDVGCGTGSLRLGFSSTGVPGRSHAHTRVNLATLLKTVGLDLSEMLQSSAEALKPPTNTTVGDPLPLHFRYILRPPPMSTNPAKLSFSAAWATATPSESTRGTTTSSNKSNRDGRFIYSLGRLQSFRHYVTGPLMPNTRGKYCPALA